ncbi:MAG: hypothetical protein QMC09_15245, partial [Thauera sp.]
GVAAFPEIVQRIDGILRRPDGEVLLWVEGSWQAARSLGLRPTAGDAAAVSPAGRRTRLRSGDSLPVELSTRAIGAVQPHPEQDQPAPTAREGSSSTHPAEHGSGAAGSALAAPESSLLTAKPALAASGAQP